MTYLLTDLEDGIYKQNFGTDTNKDLGVCDYYIEDGVEIGTGSFGNYTAYDNPRPWSGECVRHLVKVGELNPAIFEALQQTYNRI